MTEKQKFDKTVGVLVKAYLNDTLDHGSPCGCAVGNLVADAMGINLKGYRLSEGTFKWYNLIDAFRENEVEELKHYNYRTYTTAAQEIESTGYTIEQLSKIEAAFENRPHNEDGSVETDGFTSHSYPFWEPLHLGLLRVVDALAEIHHVELSDVNQAKLLFVKQE